MSWTKRQLIKQAYAAIGIASYDFDLSAEQLQDALQALDAFMAMLNGKGVRLAYPLPSGALGSDLDEDSGIPDRAIEAVYLGLAIRLAPMEGKTVSPDTKAAAAQAMVRLMSLPIPQMQLDALAVPAGSGNVRWNYGWGPMLDPARDPITAGPDSELNLGGQ